MLLLKKLIVVLIGGLALPSLLYAQPDVRLQIAGGASLSTLSSGIFQNWGNGWTLGGGLSHPLDKTVDLTLNVAYSRYPYRGGHVEFAVPAVFGYRWSLSGNPSNAIEASIGVRARTSVSAINPFLSLNAGLYRIAVGDITISSWMDASSHNVTRVVYGGSATSTESGFAALGVGFAIPLDSRMQIALEARISKTINSNEIFIPILVSVQCDL